MNAITIQTSTSLTRLAAAMAGTFSASPLPPLTHETVVTLSTGMGRWLSMELATHLGVCSGVDFRFPNDTIDACFRAVIPDIPESSPFALDTMTWRIASLLPGLLDLPAFAPLAGYLSDRSDDRRLLQLSRTLADTFDQYTIYRPEMILAWDRGSSNDWQALLWRALTADYPVMHRAALLGKFRKILLSGPVPAGLLPARISLFGISFLPPFHLDVFALLARHIDVTVYLFNPCGNYWGDLYSQKRKAELALREELPPEALEFYETGNPLLSSLGTQGQEFFNLLMEYDVVWNNLDEDKTVTPPLTLLEIIQNDVRELYDRGCATSKTAITDVDCSIAVHSCHGPLREMEILYDQLLAMFDDTPGLEPRSVLVMIPDLETYTPYIKAVFGTRSGGRPSLPFTIADQSARSDNPLIETFLSILKLSDSRFGINSILEIVETPEVMARFDLSPEELQPLRGWLEECGVRWGLDAEHRAVLGFPTYSDFSWQSGLDRLLLGYAMAADDEQLFKGLLPYGQIEGRPARAVGKLARFIDTAAHVRRMLATPQTLDAWSETLTWLTAALIRPLSENDTTCSLLYSTFQRLRDIQVKSGFGAAIGVEAVRDHLKSQLDAGSGSSGYLNGRITFCAMLPMRSIPQRVVCMVGMNDGIFPRNPRQPGFSMMAGKRRRGDRSVRDEDRYLFLEALMSASERLYISYNGQNDRDNSTMPPSVVVSELLDYVDRGFCARNTPEAAPPMVTRHRLQGFNPEYFGTGEEKSLFSFSATTCAALASRLQSGKCERVFLQQPLPNDPRLSQQLDLSQLLRFLKSPGRTFLALRLKVHPYNPADEIDEREPFELDSYSAYTIKQQLVTQKLSGSPFATTYESARAHSLLPPLRSGQIAFETVQEDSLAFADIISASLGNELKPLRFEIQLEETLLTGVLEQLQQGLHLRWSCATMKATDRLALWLDHLVLNSVQPDGYPRESRLICKDKTLSLPAMDNAVEILNDLVILFRDGLCRPLHFFPQSSWQYLEKGFEAAESRWEGRDYSLYPAEALEPSHSLCHSGRHVLDEAFRALAERIYGPLRAVAREDTTR